MKIDSVLFLEPGIGDDDLTFNGTYVPDMLAERLALVTGEVFFSIPASYQGRLKGNAKTLVREGTDDLSCWKGIFSRTASDHLLKIYIDSPFLDPEIIREMTAQHLDNLAEFTFSENIPSGLGCEIVARELVESVPDPEKETQQLGRVIRSNINQFDVELYYRDPDIRDKRIAFRTGNRRDKKIMEEILGVTGRYPSYGDIKHIIHENPQVLYAGPSYVEMEITGRCELDCIFCFRKCLPAPRGDMEPALFEKILGDMREFGLPYSICLGGSGEPLMHPEFYRLCRLALNDPLVSQIIVETNGLYINDDYRTFLRDLDRPLVKTIINLSADDTETYRAIHGLDAYERVARNVRSLKDVNSGGSLVYLQLMKIRETEPFTDRYYDTWEKENIPIIFQKQNCYLGRVADRRYSDLTPIERTPCWHLQRDLSILSDGTVTFCKQDIDGTCYKGDATGEALKSLWEQKKEFFIRDYRKSLAESPRCADCDEWYTFNL